LLPAQQKLIVQRVRNGAGLVVLGGNHSLGPGGYAGTTLDEILPVVLGDREIGQVNDVSLPTLTPDGAHHQVFANISPFFPTEQGEAKVTGLPPLLGYTRIERAKPGATVLATFNGESPPMPVLAVQPVDRGRTAVFCGDTTRNWQQGPRAMDRESPFLRFWGQMVRWLAGRTVTVEAQASITAMTDTAQYEPGEQIRLTAVVRDDQGEGAAGARVSGKIRNPAGRPDAITLTTVAGPAGHYAAEFEPQVAGTYKLVVETKLGDQTLTT
ncbi:MAG: hypothetical protein GY778_18610, partial [bacterium]|nr:hypothetical protein [bacterium]